jgi:hypothetical protein
MLRHPIRVAFFISRYVALDSRVVGKEMVKLLP